MSFLTGWGSFVFFFFLVYARACVYLHTCLMCRLCTVFVHACVSCRVNSAASFFPRKGMDVSFCIRGREGGLLDTRVLKRQPPRLLSVSEACTTTHNSLPTHTHTHAHALSQTQYVDTNSLQPLIHVSIGVFCISYLTSWRAEYRHMKHAQDHGH